MMQPTVAARTKKVGGRLSGRTGPLTLPPELLRGKPFMIVDYFKLGTSVLTRYHRALIERTAGYIIQRGRSRHPIRAVSLVGHTDASGPAAYNVALGWQRARTVGAALIARLKEISPIMARSFRVSVTSMGARQPIAPRGAFRPARSRRVAVYLVPQSSPQVRHGKFLLTSSAPSPRPPRARPCCIFAPAILPLDNNSNIADPASLGTHGASDETVGILYTSNAGFLDLGHMRDHCDLTKFVFDRIADAGGAPTNITTPNGQAVITKSIPAGLEIPVARAIAFDDGLGHEIFSYDQFHLPGGHNSSFSPEDLCSNFFGTLMGWMAISVKGDFKTAATTALSALLKLLGAQAKKDSLNAFNKINRCWVNFKDFRSVFSDGLIQRRNFTFAPWQTGDPSDGPVTTLVNFEIGNARSFYSYTHTSGRNIPFSTFPAEFARIKADAMKRYGPDFASPIC